MYKHTLIWFMYLLFVFFFPNTQPQMWIMIQLSINYAYGCCISSSFSSAGPFSFSVPHPFSILSQLPSILAHSRALPHLCPPSSSTSASQSFSCILPLPHPHLQLSANPVCAVIPVFFRHTAPCWTKPVRAREVRRQESRFSWGFLQSFTR